MDPEVEEIQNNIEEIKSRLSSQSIDKKTRRTLTDQAAALESLLLSKKSLPMNASLQAKEKRRLATEAKRDIERETAAREAEKIPDHKSEELLKLKSYLNELNLEIEEMAPDGDCLFAAIAHQLSLRDTTSAEVIRVDDVGLDDPKLDKNTLEYDAKKLRVIASNWLRQNADHYEMFLDAEEAGSNSIIEYCDRMCKPGEIWGGHLEIDALSAALNSPIIIYQADQSLIKFNENSPTAPIRIWLPL